MSISNPSKGPELSNVMAPEETATGDKSDRQREEENKADTDSPDGSVAVTSVAQRRAQEKHKFNSVGYQVLNSSDYIQHWNLFASCGCFHIIWLLMQFRSIAWLSKMVKSVREYYNSQHLKWIKTFHQSCPKTKTMPVFALGQLWWTFLIHLRWWVLYTVLIP